MNINKHLETISSTILQRVFYLPTLTILFYQGV